MKTCPVCAAEFPDHGHQRFCTDTCRKTAYRRRHQPVVEPVEVPAHQPRRGHTVYQCPDCETRYLGEQRCPDCNIFCTRIGYGAACPHCDEPVAIEDLTPGTLDPNPLPPPRSPRQR